jgi:hypothetical protein
MAMEGIYTVIIKKQGDKQKDKKSKRWTLTDWLITKKKIALMDQWLALNSSKTWFEFKVANYLGDTDMVNNGIKTSADTNKISGAIFIRMLGFEYDKIDIKENTNSNLSDQESYNAALLILGNSIQSTSVIAHYGQRKLTWPQQGQFKQDFYGGRLTLYLASFLGVQGRYDLYPTIKSTNAPDLSLKGERITLAPFIEWGALRLIGEFSTYKGRLYSQGQFLQSTEEKSGLFGLELYL